MDENTGDSFFNFITVKSNPLFLNSNILNLSLGDSSIPFVDKTKILGVIIDARLIDPFDVQKNKFKGSFALS